MWRILDRLGHPERRLPPVIHVAGTNGKGSAVAFMRAVLEAAGRSVHVYTSPHLVRFNERFRLGAPGGGRLVGDEALADALTECERVNAASRSRCSRSRPPRRSCCSRASRPMSCCSKSASAAGSTPPM